MGLTAIVVAASCVLAGLVCGASLNARITAHHSVLDRFEPFAYAAQNLYAALSAADAASASAFLSGGIQTASTRTRYQQALASGASAVADATAGATDRDSRTAVAEMSAQLAARVSAITSGAGGLAGPGRPTWDAGIRPRHSATSECSWPGASPSRVGLRTTYDGLGEALGWAQDERVRYLMGARGVTPTWTSARIVERCDTG